MFTLRLGLGLLGQTAILTMFLRRIDVKLVGT